MANDPSVTGKVAVIGQSHVSCVEAAYRAMAGAGAKPDFDITSLQLLRQDIPYLVHLDGVWRYNPVIDDEISEFLAHERPMLTVLMLEGQHASGSGFVPPVRPYDFHVPGEPYQRACEGELVPYGMALEATAALYTHVDAFVGRIKPSLGVNTIALSPPPPIGDNQRLRGLIAEANEQLRQIGYEAGELPSPLWRAKTWRLHVTALGMLHARHGIAFLPPPAAALIPGGFIAQALISDAFHGNQAYGALLLRQIEGVLASGMGLRDGVTV